MKVNLQLFATTEKIANSTLRGDQYQLKYVVTDVKNSNNQDYDVANNTSDITYSVRVYKNWGSGYYDEEKGNPLLIKLNEETIVNTKIAFDTRGKDYIELASGRKTIKHDDDGSKKISFYASFNTNTPYEVTLGTFELSGEHTLPKIPRKSIINNVNDYQDYNGFNGVPITFTKYISNSTTTLIISVVTDEDSTLTIKQVNNINSGYVVKFTQTELNLIYNNTKTIKVPKINYEIQTKYNNALIGTSTTSSNFIFYDISPILFSFDWEDTNSITTKLTNFNKSIIPKYSDIKISIPSDIEKYAEKGAYLVKYKFQDGKFENYSATNIVTHKLSKYNYGSTISVIPIDSRGFEGLSEWLAQDFIIPYNSVPIITKLQANRMDGVSTDVILNLNAKLCNVEFGSERKNEVTKFEYRFKRPNETWNNQTWYNKTSEFKQAINGQDVTNISINDSMNFKLHLNGTSGGVPLVDYNLQVRLYDGYGNIFFNSDIEECYINDGKFLDSYHKTSTGYQYAINGMVDTSLKDGLQVYGNLYVNGKVFIQTKEFNINFISGNGFPTGSGSIPDELKENCVILNIEILDMPSGYSDGYIRQYYFYRFSQSYLIARTLDNVGITGNIKVRITYIEIA